MLKSWSAEKRAGLFGVGWTTLAHFLTMLARLASMLVLTRLLSPDAYGIFVSALTAVLILNMVTDLGIRPGLMRHPQGMTAEFLGTGWIIGIRRGLFLSASLLAFSYFLPIINDTPQTGFVLRLICVLPFLHSLQSPNLPRLYREMRYREISLIEIGQFVVGSIAGISAALITPTEIALVSGIIANEIAFVALSYYFAPVETRPRWNPIAGHELSHFGWQIFLNTLVMALWLHSERIFGLKFISETEMGLYSIAWSLTELIDRLLSRITDVYFSMLSRRSDRESQMAMQHKLNRQIGRYGMPLLMIGIILAPLVVQILYRPAYHGAGILFALLIARQMVRTLGAVQFQYLLICGDVHVATRCYLVAFFVQIICYFPLILRFGAIGMAWAGIISTIAYTYLQGWLAYRRNEAEWEPYLLTLFWAALGIGILHFVWK